MFSEGIIERSASDYSSAPVMIRKHDGSFRFCVDYRDLYKVTRKDAYPIPSMDSILDKLRRARYLTTINLKQAYYQIPMEPASREYTAFAVPGSGLWQFKRMPFGLTNASMTFQRLIDSLFGPEFQPNVFGYLDDIIIATETFEEYRYWVELVLKRLVEARMKLNKEKCEVCCSRVAYLGFLLDREGQRPDPEKVASVLEYPAPRNINQLRRFLGMVGWYARFIKNESSTKVPLVNCCTILGSGSGDGEHPIVYINRVMSPAENNYSTTEKECLAMLWVIKKLRPSLEGYQFSMITDHSALKWLYKLKEPSGRLARWALQLQQWDFEIIHRKGALITYQTLFYGFRRKKWESPVLRKSQIQGTLRCWRIFRSFPRNVRIGERQPIQVSNGSAPRPDSKQGGEMEISGTGRI